MAPTTAEAKPAASAEKPAAAAKPAAPAPAPKASGFDFKAVLAIVGGIFKDPAKGLENASTKFKDAKFAWIFTGIAVVVSTILALLTTIFSSVVTVSVSLFKGTKREIDWSNINDIKFWDTIWTNFVAYAIVALGVAGIAFIVGLILQKRADYKKLVGIVALVLLFNAAGGLIAAILNLAWAPFHMIITSIVGVFTVVLAVAGIDKEMGFTGGTQIWFHIITWSALILLTYWLITVVLKEAMASYSLDMLDSFKGIF